MKLDRELLGCFVVIAMTFFVFGMCWQIVISPTPGDFQELKSCALMADAGFDIQLTERGCDVNWGKQFQQVDYVCAHRMGQVSLHCFHEGLK